MINRILIRIKVVQMLYSYLLTRSDFNINAAPERDTRDARYAYNVYIQTLILIARLAGLKIDGIEDNLNVDTTSKNALKTSEIASTLANNSDLREIAIRRGIDINDFKNIFPYIADLISSSDVYLEFARKRKRDLQEECNVWSVIIEEILRPDAQFKDAARNNPDFTYNGFEKGLEMAVDSLRNYTDLRSSLMRARNSLRRSLDQAYDLYLALVMLPAEITRLREEQIESAREKYLPTAEDLNPNLKFINNKFISSLLRSGDVKDIIGKTSLLRTSDYYLLKRLLDDIMASPIYAEYMESGPTTLEEDCEFWRAIMKDVIFPSDSLAEALESKSIFWNDDLNIVGQFVLKTIRRTANDRDGLIRLMPQFKDSEDEQFGDKLFVDVVENFKEYRKLIDRFINTAQWDAERIVLMDVVIMATAIAEILNFPLIPIVVSLNEYIEIANYYSNPRSGQFINGALYSIINHLRSEGVLYKEIDSKAK